MPLKPLGKTNVIFKGKVKVKSNEDVLPLQPAPVRERLSESMEGWKCITNDPYVLSIVTKGYRLHFYESIPSLRDPLRNNPSSGARRNSGHAGTIIPYAPEECSDRGASEFPWVSLKSIPGMQSFRRVASSNGFKKSERSHFCTSFLYVHYKLSSEYPAKGDYAFRGTCRMRIFMYQYIQAAGSTSGLPSKTKFISSGYSPLV